MANIQIRIGFAAATMLAASGITGTANAQEGAVALEEIVVTARRVEERLQDVPLAITAFSAGWKSSRRESRIWTMWRTSLPV